LVSTRKRIPTEAETAAFLGDLTLQRWSSSFLAACKTVTAGFHSRKKLGSLAWALVAAALGTGLTGCGADGPIIGICGTNVGRAEDLAGDGPVYVNASSHAPGTPIVAAAGSDPMNVRVSSDCSLGARISVSNPRIIRASEEIRARDGADEVLSVYPLRAGSATLTAHRAGARPLILTFVVKPPVHFNPSTAAPSST
jgi:hypothetical protein